VSRFEIKDIVDASDECIAAKENSQTQDVSGFLAGWARTHKVENAQQFADEVKELVEAELAIRRLAKATGPLFSAKANEPLGASDSAKPAGSRTRDFVREYPFPERMARIAAMFESSELDDIPEPPSQSDGEQALEQSTED